MIVMTYIYDYIYLYVANWIIDVRNIKATFFMFLINLIHIITPLLDRVEFASLEKLFRLETWPACLMRRDHSLLDTPEGPQQLQDLPHVPLPERLK